MQFRSIFAIVIAATHTAPALAGKKGDCFMGLYETGGRNPNHIVGQETPDDSGTFKLRLGDGGIIHVKVEKCQFVSCRGWVPWGYEVLVFPSVGYDPNRKTAPPSQPKGPPSQACRQTGIVVKDSRCGALIPGDLRRHSGIIIAWKHSEATSSSERAKENQQVAKRNGVPLWLTGQEMFPELSSWPIFLCKRPKSNKNLFPSEQDTQVLEALRLIVTSEESVPAFSLSDFYSSKQ